MVIVPCHNGQEVVHLVPNEVLLLITAQRLDDALVALSQVVVRRPQGRRTCLSFKERNGLVAPSLQKRSGGR